MKKIISNCHLCGVEVERTKKFPISTCFACKSKKNREKSLESYRLGKTKNLSTIS